MANSFFLAGVHL